MRTILQTISIIFTLLFLSSCSNDFTGIGEGIDKKYSAVYSSEISKKEADNIIEYGKASFTVNEDGSVKGLITYYGVSASEEIEFSKEKIIKINDNSYTASFNFSVVRKYTFTFIDNIMELTINNEDGSVTYGKLIKIK